MLTLPPRKIDNDGVAWHVDDVPKVAVETLTMVLDGGGGEGAGPGAVGICTGGNAGNEAAQL